MIETSNSIESDQNKNKRTCILVEDDGMNAEVIMKYLSEDFNVTWVSDPKAAIKKLEKSKFDLILMDLGLKGDMDGIQASKLIKSMPEYNGAPIIAVTAYAMLHDRKKALTSGLDEYISKPFYKQDLLRLIQKFVK